MNKVLVLIPTYNEAGNIGSLIDQLMALDVPNRIDILVRDDKSPDGTAVIVGEYAEKYPGHIYLEHGEKKGLGAALRSSFDSIKANYDHEFVISMDADFSHDPADVRKIILALNDGADVAIGSRYTQGGLIPGDWGLFFFVRTYVATRVARWLGGVNEDIKELTTNLRGMRREVLMRANYSRIQVSGYAFQIMLTNELTKRDWKVVEVPIAFRSRVEGKTKSRTKDIFEFFAVAYRLNPDSPAKQVLRFMTIGASGAFVNLGALHLLAVNTALGPVLLSLAAIQVSIVWNFYWHTAFTFRSRRRSTDKWLSVLTLRDFGTYEASVAFVQVLTVLVSVTLRSAGVYILLAQALGICVAFILNYQISKARVWNIKQSLYSTAD